MQDARIDFRIEVRFCPMQKTSVIPHQHVAQAPGVPVLVARLRRMFLKAQDKRPA